ncbi:hypothetical protein AJ80_05103 [Polytolypa hystricis UAMH7299]|uniref:FAD/NAD(P)-binding domain-containing protein n=1 Tax=Polytolypa hystricis (strain UAMH7299) TaxID=1447883 RepID=A0A2B7Y791_POLH7|nr:hypothetical protein AJ80_05103 [Polytolypa hystricis UAMH7299]
MTIHHQSQHVTNGKPKEKTSNWVPVLEQSLYKPRKLRVVCVGAGYSGLMVAYRWKHQMCMEDYIDLTIYEKNSDIGGTWLENRYPGVACDVPAPIYTFSFEPNPDWSSFYASGPEIWEYQKRTVKKYNLDERVQLNSKVVSTVWNDEKGKWLIKVERDGAIIEDEAEILINGAGILNKWHWPSIKGLHSFRGKLVHSASWDPTIDWTDKRVAIIGNGSSALQILPQMQPTAAKITNYIRSSTWVSTNFVAQSAPDGKNFKYTEEQKQRLRENPEELLQLRRSIEHSFNKFFYALISDSPEQAAVYATFKKTMEERLNHNPELCAKLIPEWKVGCRRLSPGDGYLEALQQSNVSAEFSEIQEVNEKGIVTVGGSTEGFDIIVCATGFDVSFSPFWELVGRDGINLADQWRDSPDAYFGICAPNIPNYFIFNGPNCPIGHGNLLAVMEWTADYIMKWCEKIAKEDIKSVYVDSGATDDYNVYSQEFLKRTVWTSGCRSWYKNGKKEGRVTAMYAGSVMHYKEILESFRTEDFRFEYSSPNRFRFMGNGFTIREEKGGDLAYYRAK